MHHSCDEALIHTTIAHFFGVAQYREIETALQQLQWPLHQWLVH